MKEVPSKSQAVTEKCMLFAPGAKVHGSGNVYQSRYPLLHLPLFCQDPVMEKKHLPNVSLETLSLHHSNIMLLPELLCTGRNIVIDAPCFSSNCGHARLFPVHEGSSFTTEGICFRQLSFLPVGFTNSEHINSAHIVN